MAQVRRRRAKRSGSRVAEQLELAKVELAARDRIAHRLLDRDNLRTAEDVLWRLDPDLARGLARWRGEVFSQAIQAAVEAERLRDARRLLAAGEVEAP